MILLFYLRLVYPSGKPITPHLLRFQGFAVANYSFTLDALDLGHPRLSLNKGTASSPFVENGRMKAVTDTKREAYNLDALREGKRCAFSL
jgi:hypothetical protein